MIVCKECGIFKEVNQFHLDRFVNHFCSRKCFSSYRKKTTLYQLNCECKNCGKKLRRPKGRLSCGIPIFCNRSCFVDYRREHNYWSRGRRSIKLKDNPKLIAYMLGAFMGDGSSYTNTKKFGFGGKSWWNVCFHPGHSVTFAKKLYNCLTDLGLYCKIGRSYHPNPQIHVSAYSKELYYLCNSSSIDMLNLVNGNFGDFIVGFHDADGTKYHNSFLVHNTNKELMYAIFDRLNLWKLHPKISVCRLDDKIRKPLYAIKLAKENAIKFWNSVGGNSLPVEKFPVNWELLEGCK